MMFLHYIPHFCKVFIKNPIWGYQSSHDFQLVMRLPPLVFCNHPSSDHVTIFKNGFVVSCLVSAFRGDQD